jgi:hypothetical protein
MKLSWRDVAHLLIVLGVGGYSFYGSMTGTGLGGWLNNAQQAIFGSYWWKFSVILAMGLAGVLALLAEFVWNMVSGSQGDFEQSIGYRILFGPKATRPRSDAGTGHSIAADGPDNRWATRASDGRCLGEGISEMEKKELPCCGLVDAGHVMELPHVYQFDFDLYQCGQCARYWVYAWRWPGSEGWEEVTVEDAEKMQSLGGNELRAFMKEWARSFD